VNNFNFLWLFDPSVQPQEYLKMVKQLQFQWVVANPHILQNPAFIPSVKEKDLSLGLNFPVFCPQDFLTKHPECYGLSSKGLKTQQDWLHFACPENPDFLEYQKKDLRNWLERAEPKLVSLDFIRHFIFWEKVPLNMPPQDMNEGCYCPRCMDSLAKAFGENLRQLSPHQLKEHHGKELAQFRKRRITQVAKELSGIIKEWDSQVPVMMKIIPWLEEEHQGARSSIAGQDLESIKDFIDIFSIMSFLHIRQESPEKMKQLAQEVRDITGKKITLTLQSRSIYGEPELDDERFVEYWESLKEAGPLGFNVFDYNSLCDAPERLKLLQALINE
jgi:hypothetical protein